MHLSDVLQDGPQNMWHKNFFWCFLCTSTEMNCSDICKVHLSTQPWPHSRHDIIRSYIIPRCFTPLTFSGGTILPVRNTQAWSNSGWDFAGMDTKSSFLGLLQDVVTELDWAGWFGAKMVDYRMQFSYNKSGPVSRCIMELEDGLSYRIKSNLTV